MIILTIRTDKPEAEIGLFDDDKKLSYESWQAHRKLAETLHGKIRSTLAAHGLALEDVNGIVCFKGPGSFTGLRIGLTVANALSYALKVPVVAETDDDWCQKSVSRLQKGDDERIAMPAYGADVHITRAKH